MVSVLVAYMTEKTLHILLLYTRIVLVAALLTPRALKTLILDPSLIDRKLTSILCNFRCFIIHALTIVIALLDF